MKLNIISKLSGTLHNGQLIVNGQPISNSQFTTSQVNWTQQSTGAYSTGSLTVENGGMELSRMVSIGTTAQDAVSYDVWATAAPEITYQTQITTQRSRATSE